MTSAYQGDIHNDPHNQVEGDLRISVNKIEDISLIQWGFTFPFQIGVSVSTPTPKMGCQPPL